MTYVYNYQTVNNVNGITILIFTIFMLIIIRPLNKFTKERIALYILFFKVFLNFYRKRFDSRPELFRYFDCLLSIFEVFLSIWTFWWYFRLVIFEIFQKFELFFLAVRGFLLFSLFTHVCCVPGSDAWVSQLPNREIFSSFWPPEMTLQTSEDWRIIPI